MPELAMEEKRSAENSCSPRSARETGAVGIRLALGLGIAALLALLVFWLRSGPDTTPGSSSANVTSNLGAAEPMAHEPQRAPRPDFFEPDEEGKLTIPASALESGEPVLLEFSLRPDEIGDQPMTARIRSNRHTYELGEATLDRQTGRARLSIDAARLPPGQHLLAVRIEDSSWNPNRRFAITVTED
jgi:hypothetical protein